MYDHFSYSTSSPTFVLLVKNKVILLSRYWYLTVI